VLVHKKLDAGRFEIPKPTRDGEQHIVVSDAIFDVTFAGVPIEKRVRRRRRIHWLRASKERIASAQRIRHLTSRWAAGLK